MIGMLLGVGILASTFCYYENNKLEISEFNIKIDIENKVRILQLSDLHGKMFGKDNKILFELIKKKLPDIIVATGDLIDSNLKNMDETIDFLSRLNKFRPVIYIPGNNELRTRKYEYILRKLREKEVIVLQNEMLDININKTKVSILGLVEKSYLGSGGFNNSEFKYKFKEEDKLLKELENKKGVKIVLSHFPENFKTIGKHSYSKYKFDIMFSGHAHGGQFRVPFLGGLFAPGQGILPKYYQGIHGKESKLVISRGLGNSGFPLRLFNRPNVVVVDLY